MIEFPLTPALRDRMGDAYDAHEQGRMGEARRICEELLAINPAIFAANYLLGSILVERGEGKRGIAYLTSARLLRPDAIDTLSNLGVALIKDLRFGEAIEPLQRAVSLAPTDTEILTHLVYALTRVGRSDEALQLCATTLQRLPGDIHAVVATSRTMRSVGRIAEALAIIQSAAREQPHQPLLLLELARILTRLEALPAAQEAAVAAKSLDPDMPQIDSVLGEIAARDGDFAAAIAHFRRALMRLPHGQIETAGLASAALLSCSWGDLTPLVPEIRADAEDGLMPMSTFESFILFDDPALHLKIGQAESRDKNRVESPVPISNGSKDGRIRVGYLSGDFRRHATSILIGDLFALHDRSAFETIALSIGPDDRSEFRRRIENSVDQFHDLRSLDSTSALSKVRSIELDILVDLNGHTREARTDVVLARAAPVQVNYLGFAGSMGDMAYDYIIADQFVAPLGTEINFTEKLARLPDSYQPNSRRLAAPGVADRATFGLPEKGFVFCCFNDVKKISPEIFAVWVRILQRTSGSVLWLMGSNALAEANLLTAAEVHGLDPGRLIFARSLDFGLHFQRIPLADLFLDTRPYNAHTTASDALAMGLPLITCPGRSFASRVAMGLLHSHGLPELVVDNLVAYEDLAVALAHDPPRLAALRAKTLANVDSHPLFDLKRYTRHLETAFRMMVDRHRAGLPPASFDVR